MEKTMRLELHDGQAYENEIEAVKVLNDLLADRTGITFEIVAGNTLRITYDEEVTNRKLGIRLGRKKAETDKLVTVGEVRRMMQEMVAEHVAAELGISRATLYRKLKEHADTPSEWYFV